MEALIEFVPSDFARETFGLAEESYMGFHPYKLLRKAFGDAAYDQCIRKNLTKGIYSDGRVHFFISRTEAAQPDNPPVRPIGYLRVVQDNVSLN